MANKFARSNGNFDGPIWALTSGGVAGSTTAPTIGDNAVANTFTVQITGNVACDNITNGTTYGGTTEGSFNITNTVEISANISSGDGNTYINPCINLTGSSSATIYGNVVVGGAYSGTRAINKSTSGFLTIYGSIFGGGGGGGVNAIVDGGTGPTKVYGNVSNSNSGGSSNSQGIAKTGTGSLEVYGNVAGGSTAGNVTIIQSSATGAVTVYGNLNGSTASALSNTSTGAVTVYGNLNGSTASALSNTSTGAVTVYGNLNGSTASALSNTSTGAVNIVGNITSNSRGGAGITSTNALANVRISGNLIGAPNGIPAVYAASYTVNPVPYQTYIRYANNGTGVGSDAYLYHYTTDSLSAFSIPPVSAVRAGLQYANNTLTGTCEIPAASAVTFGALVDNTTGTAALTSNNLFDVSVASLTATNSLGERLKNSATVESVGRIIASFSN